MATIRARLNGYWDGLPRWFRIAFIILAVAYMAAWSYSAILATCYSGNVSIPVIPKDSTEYADLSSSIIASHSFSLDGSVPETFRTPGYPGFVAIIRMAADGSFLAVTLVQALLALLTALIIQRIGARYFSEQAGAVAGTIFLLNPTTLIISLVIHSEIPFVFLFMLIFWIISRDLEKHFWRTAIWSGVLTAAAMYVRPIGFMAFPIFLAPIMVAKLDWKKKTLAAGTLIAVTMLLLVPWMARNKAQTGVFGYSSLMNQSILMYSIPMFRAHQNGDTVAAEAAKEIADTGVAQTHWRELASDPKLHPYIVDFVKQDIFPYAKWHAVITIPFFFASDIEWAGSVYSIAMHQQWQYGQAAIFDLAKGDVGSFLSKIVTPWWKFSERLLICLFWASAIYDIVKMRRRGIVWIMLAIIVYMALATGPVATARHRFPVDPFIYLLASAGIVSYLESRKKSL